MPAVDLRLSAAVKVDITPDKVAKSSHNIVFNLSGRGDAGSTAATLAAAIGQTEAKGIVPLELAGIADRWLSASRYLRSEIAQGTVRSGIVNGPYP